MRIRQVALAASDLEKTDATLRRLLGCDQSYADPEIIYFGLDNRLYTLGDCFLEVVSPVQPNTAAGRFLDRRGGDGGYMVIVQVENLAQEQVRLSDTGIRTVFADDRGNAKAIHLHPKDVPGAIPSLDEMRPPESWLWAGDGWEQRAGRHTRGIRAVEIRSLDPRATGLCWAEAYGIELMPAGEGWRLEMGGTEIRFTHDAAVAEPALMAIDVDAVDLPAICAAADDMGLERDGHVVTVCGVEFNFLSH
jgi:catechol 2,3-dioxygenase-like lactoylglutathione lyase family enzyme